MPALSIAQESWPSARSFTIARGSKTAAEVVVVTLEEEGHRGRGECVPYPRYNETVEGVVASLEAARAGIEAGFASLGSARVIALRDLPGDEPLPRRQCEDVLR